MLAHTHEPPKVFISYSHDSPKHADRVLELSNRLQAEGIDCVLDQYEVSPPEGWPRWMDKHIREADFVLMICTETYCRRVIGEEKPDTGLGVRWEGNLIYQHIYSAGALNTRFIPVLLESGKPEHIPAPIRGATYYRADTAEGYEGLYRHLTNQPRTLKPELGKLRKLPPRERKQDFFASDHGTVPRALSMARRALAILEEQAAGFGKLNIPTHLQINLEEKRREVAELETRLKDLEA